MNIKKLGDSEVFKLLLTMILILEACMISASLKDGVSAIMYGIKYTIVLNRVEAEEVARGIVDKPVNISSTGLLSDQSDGHNPRTGEDIEGLVRRYFGSEYGMARAIMMAESGGEPTRVGDTHLRKYSYGLFQINQTWHHYSEKELLDPETNIRIAKEIRDKYGWTQWTTFRTNQYKDYL